MSWRAVASRSRPPPERRGSIESDLRWRIDDALFVLADASGPIWQRDDGPAVVAALEQPLVAARRTNPARGS